MPRHPIDLERLLSNAISIVKRDIQHINKQVKDGKLADKSAKDIVHYVKILSDILADKKDIYKKTKKELDGLSTEQLEELIEK